MERGETFVMDKYIYDFIAYGYKKFNLPSINAKDHNSLVTLGLRSEVISFYAIFAFIKACSSVILR